MDDLLKVLIDKGKRQGHLTIQEVKDDLPESVGADSDSLEFFVNLLKDMNIKIIRPSDN